MHNYDLVINYDELTKDRIINIKIINSNAALWQYSAVYALISLANMFSPVKFSIVFE